MPFTTPLRSIPVPPDPYAAYTDKDGKPSQDLYDHLKALQACLVAVQAALGETGQATPLLVAGLPSAVGKTGVRYTVTDATATTFMSTVAGGGANIVQVVSLNGLWKIG